MAQATTPEAATAVTSFELVWKPCPERSLGDRPKTLVRGIRAESPEAAMDVYAGWFRFDADRPERLGPTVCLSGVGDVIWVRGHGPSDKKGGPT